MTRRAVLLSTILIVAVVAVLAQQKQSQAQITQPVGKFILATGRIKEGGYEFPALYRIDTTTGKTWRYINIHFDKDPLFMRYDYWLEIDETKIRHDSRIEPLIAYLMSATTATMRAASRSGPGR